MIGIALPATTTFGMSLLAQNSLRVEKGHTWGNQVWKNQNLWDAFGVPPEPSGFRTSGRLLPELDKQKLAAKFGGRRLVFGQLLRVLVCSGTGPESPTGSPDLLIQAALAAHVKLLSAANRLR